MPHLVRLLYASLLALACLTSWAQSPVDKYLRWRTGATIGLPALLKVCQELHPELAQDSQAAYLASTFSNPEADLAWKNDALLPAADADTRRLIGSKQLQIEAVTALPNEALSRLCADFPKYIKKTEVAVFGTNSRMGTPPPDASPAEVTTAPPQILPPISMEFDGQRYFVVQQVDPDARLASFNRGVASRHSHPIQACELLIDLPVGTARGNHSFGGVCIQAQNSRRTKVMICNDDMIGHFAIQAVDGHPITLEELAHFVADNCYGG